MQQEPTIVTPPSKNQYLIRGLVYGLVGVALLGLAIYFNSLDTINIFTTGDTSNHNTMNAFGCLSGLIFIAGMIILFVPVVLFRTYHRQLAMASSPGIQQAKVQKNGEVDAFLSGVGGVLGWIIGSGRLNRAVVLSGFVMFASFFALARGLMNLNLTIIGTAIGMAVLGLVMRVIFGGFR